MKFHSLTFAAFLIGLFALYWLAARHRSLRYALLLVGSCVFYAAFETWYLLLILGSTVLDYTCGGIIASSESPGRRKAALLASLCGNLGLLCFFKYWDWGVASLGALLAQFGIDPPLEILGLVVPVGISFYTFQTLSYTIDVYRGVLRPARTFLEFALFVSFFPQLVAGPIVRAKEFLPQLDLVPRFDKKRMHDGLWRIALGLAKKTLVADTLGRFLVDPLYERPGDLSAPVHFLGLLGFLFQIYADFSAYSDIAIGTARLFGFDLPENFQLPYRSRSLREFWRRWHITLSSWVRDYMYFPLGGSRGGEWKVARNLWITMLVIGLWHGASSLWVAYGLLNGSVMIWERFAERTFGPPRESRALDALRLARTLLLNIGLLVLIRASDWDEAIAVTSEFGAGGFGAIDPLGWWALGAALFMHYSPFRLHTWTRRAFVGLPTPLLGVLVGAEVGLLLWLAADTPPFIYFQF